MFIEGNSQVARHKCKFDDWCRNPQSPQGLTAVPDLIVPLVVSMLEGVGLPFHQALHCVERGKVHEAVTAEPRRFCHASTAANGNAARGGAASPQNLDCVECGKVHE